uniref:NSvc2 protein n=1 Tax=Tenuivirus oryzaclavatae TaxID=3052763 RepID=Q809B5_9VIRU|nr:NSvc2 protein [Tenuivirus oryzaclavatae]
MHFKSYFIYTTIFNMAWGAPIPFPDTHSWMRNREREASEIVKVPCSARAPPCKLTYELNGYFIENGLICYNRASVNYFETCYTGNYDYKLPLHPSFSKFGGHVYISCHDATLQNVSLVGIQQTEYTSSPLLITNSNSEKISYSNLKTGFLGIVYAVEDRACIQPAQAKKPEEIINHGVAIKPSCTDGVLYYINSSCEVNVSDQTFSIPSCESVKLPTYDDTIEVCDKGGCQNVTCHPGEICDKYERMDMIMRIKNYQCSHIYRYSLYSIILFFVIVIVFTLITIMNILFFLKPAFWLLKKVLYSMVGLCHRRPVVDEVSVDMSTVRVVDEAEEGLLVVEDSIAPNTNVSDKVKRNGRKVENGMIFIPYVLMILLLVCSAESCQDLVSSISNIERCTNNSCDFISKMKLTLLNTPQDFCFKTSTDVYKIRFNSVRVMCLSVPLYYTNSFKRVISREEWKCFEGEGCRTDGTHSIWGESTSLSFDYCVTDFHIFSYCPAYHYNWKRIEYEPTSSRACTIMKCMDTKFEIVGYIQKNGHVLKELGGITSKYDSPLVSISLSNYNSARMPREYAECDGKAYLRTANDLGSFDKELLGNIQCPTKEDAVVLSSKCKTKILSNEDLPVIRYVERDGVDMLEHVKSEPLKDVLVSSSGISLGTLDLFPVELNLQFKEAITSIITSKISLNGTSCKITGIERKFKKTTVSIESSNKVYLSDILACEGLAVCPMILNNIKKGTCITTTYYSVTVGSMIKCKFIYSGDTLMCKYDVSPLEITVISPSLDVSSFEAVKTSTTNWMELLAGIVKDNPKLSLVASIIPIGLILKTIRSFLDDIRQVD